MKQSVQEQVIKVIEKKGECTVQDLSRELPHVKLTTLANAAHSLRRIGVLAEACKRKVGRGPGRGATVFRMIAPMPNLPDKRPNKKKYHKEKGIKSERTDIPLVISLRDRKIELLKQLADNSGGQTRDLLIGIIVDYGGTYT